MEQSIISLNLKKTGCHLLTRQIFHQGPRLSGDGLLHLASLTPGTSVSLNENADPTVRPDLQQAFTLMSNDSPVEAAVLMGLTLSIPVQGGRPDLGTWQGVYVANFTGNAAEEDGYVCWMDVQPAYGGWFFESISIRILPIQDRQALASLPHTFLVAILGKCPAQPLNEAAFPLLTLFVTSSRKRKVLSYFISNTPLLPLPSGTMLRQSDRN
eukprot:TRINITY_DN12103_c0_g1_i10.p1 TRINITY_DN12103_c0_g1~~TRINITY_DN12103_c0_g1_i10.p1  ORF type:complete len:212 (+),score=22.26 TRINITY_DN12103_c0_g1_i10:1395-2030(+)